MLVFYDDFMRFVFLIKHVMLKALCPPGGSLIPLQISSIQIAVWNITEVDSEGIIVFF